MKREQYEHMVLIARELLDMDEHGLPIDPLTRDWARQVVHMQPTPPMPVPYRQRQVIKAMRDHPPEGMLAHEVTAASGLSKKCCAVTLSYMAKHQQLAMLKILGRSRYFTDQAALERGRPLVEAAEQRLRDSKVKVKVKPIRPPKPVPPKPAPRPRTTPAKARRGVGRGKSTAGVQEQGVYVAAALPPNVRIQAIAHQVDRRFIPEPPIQGIGAVAQWVELTRRLRSRGK